jgi:hypothetical protein
MRPKSDSVFWSRFVLTTALMNLPLAWAQVGRGLSLIPAMVYAAMSGAVLLAIWDGTRDRDVATVALDEAPLAEIRALPVMEGTLRVATREPSRI